MSSISRGSMSGSDDAKFSMAGHGQYLVLKKKFRPSLEIKIIRTSCVMILSGDGDLITSLGSVDAPLPPDGC